MELILILLVGGALSLGEIRGGYVPGGSLGSMSADGGAVIPPRLLFGLGLLGPDGWGQIFPKWPLLEEHMLMIVPKTTASNVLPLQ